MDEKTDLIEQSIAKFLESTEKLKKSHHSLQTKIDELNISLEEKNHELEKSLREVDSTKNLLNSIIESMTNGLIMVDLNGEILTINSAAERILKISKNDVLNKNYIEIFPNRKISPLSVIKTGKAYYQRDIVIKNSLDEDVSIELSLAPVRDSKDKLLGVVEVFQDLTEIKKLEEEVNQAKTMAALGEMAANVAHEIRNPLGGIEGYASLLKREIKGSERQQRIVTNILEGSRSLNRIVTSLLKYTKPIKLLKSEFNISKLIDSSLFFIQYEFQKKEIKIEKNILENVEIFADKNLLKQVLINVLKNAFEAIETKGIITIMTDIIEDFSIQDYNGFFAPFSEQLLPEKTKMIRVSISDTGVGIEEQNLRKLFHPFFTSKEDGTGLGLSLSQKIISHHKGYMLVESQLNRGTNFTLFLPLK